jgi:hypothetical protein|tara:strand:+ start:247 stop:705 length:459 start_codon:yes stop_codon:yes gene_type:complete
MKIQEKYLWLGALLIMGAVIHQQYTTNNNLSFLLKTYDAEDKIQDRQLLDLHSQISSSRAEEYNRGFEQGKTQAAITLMKGDSLANYADGYHAALDQFDGDLSYDAEILQALKSIDTDWEDIEKDYLEIIDLLLTSYDQELEQIVPVAISEK